MKPEEWLKNWCPSSPYQIQDEEPAYHLDPEQLATLLKDYLDYECGNVSCTACYGRDKHCKYCQ